MFKAEKIFEFHKKLSKFLKTELINNDDLRFEEININSDEIVYKIIDSSGACFSIDELKIREWWGERI